VPTFRTAAHYAKRFVTSPPRVEARVDQSFALISSTNQVVLGMSQQLAQVVAVAASQGDLRSELDATFTAQMEALTFLNRSLKELSQRIADLEAASHS
jgi:hypothetical protein